MAMSHITLLHAGAAGGGVLLVAALVLGFYCAHRGPRKHDPRVAPGQPPKHALPGVVAASSFGRTPGPSAYQAQPNFLQPPENYYMQPQPAAMMGHAHGGFSMLGPQVAPYPFPQQQQQQFSHLPMQQQPMMMAQPQQYQQYQQQQQPYVMMAQPQQPQGVVRGQAQLLQQQQAQAAMYAAQAQGGSYVGGVAAGYAQLHQQQQQQRQYPGVLNAGQQQALQQQQRQPNSAGYVARPKPGIGRHRK